MCVYEFNSNIGFFELGDNVKMPITGLEETDKTDRKQTRQTRQRQKDKARDSRDKQETARE